MASGSQMQASDVHNGQGGTQATSRRWLLMVLAVLGTFFTTVTGGLMLAEKAGLWDFPFAGFFAAFVVDVVAYLAAPSHRLRSAAITLCVGAVAAWRLLEPSFFPEHPARYAAVAYRSTHLPMIAKYIGGVLGLAVVALFVAIARSRSKLDHASKK